MSRQLFYDVPGGDTIKYDIVDESNGYRQATFLMDESIRFDNFKNIRNVKCRDDDIFLHSYPKTGTNWVWEMITLMINKTANVVGTNKMTGMIEAHPASSIEDMPSPRLLNTHLKVQYIPKEMTEKKLKSVLICRNPKDVVVSFYNHTVGISAYEYSGKFENYLQMFMRGEVDYGSYAEYLLEWQQYIRDNPDLPVHVLYYEDLKENCVAELQQLRDFLGLDVNDNLIQQIADNCSVDKMRESKMKAIMAEGKGDTLTEMLFKKDFKVIRKGQIGDWKNWFTVAQREVFDVWWTREIKDLDMFKFRYF